jgi:translation initiation factor 2B subunit (eIF-2B alpha/beta/delta family)
MNQKDRDNLYKLLRDQADLLGSTRVTELALECFIRAIRQLKCTRETILPLFNELSAAIKNSRPRIVPLIHLLEEFEDEMRFTRESLDVEAVRADAINTLHEKLEAFRGMVAELVDRGANCVQEGDVILVHSASGVIIQVLVKAWGELGRRFRVIVLQQDFLQTRQLIQALTGAGIPHEVVPEYNLGHCLDRATKLFIAALAVTPDQHLVAPAGTANIVSLCHLSQVPVTLFVNRLKFSHQPAEAQQIHRKETESTRDGVTYSLTTHSHNLVPLRLVDNVVTESGTLKNLEAAA